MIKLIGRLVLVCFAVSTSFLILEFAVRHYYPQIALYKLPYVSFPCLKKGEYRWAVLSENKSCILKSTTNGFPPLHIQTNSLGLRNGDIDTAKQKDTTRILFIGDSFTMGWGVQEYEVYPRIAEALLNQQHLSSRFEVINGGFPAADPSDYYLYLKNDGLALNPDIIVVGFYIGNDVSSRSDLDWTKVDSQGLPESIDSKSLYVSPDGQLRVKTNLQKYQIPLISDSRLVSLVFDKFFVQEKTVKIDNMIFNQNVCLYKKSCTYLENEKKDTQKLFLGMQKIATENGKKLIIVMIPAEYQIFENKEDKYNITIPLTYTEKHMPQSEFKDFFTRNSMDFIDLLPIFEENKETPTYFEKDDHWNKAGQSLAAVAISKKLSQYFTQDTSK